MDHDSRLSSNPKLRIEIAVAGIQEGVGLGRNGQAGRHERREELLILNMLQRMCYDSGPLTGVKYGTDDGVLQVVKLEFALETFAVVVQKKDDTLRVIDATHQLPAAAGDASTQHPWLEVMGQEPDWAWMLTNQQGYEDGFQLQFPLASDGWLAIQMIAIASRIELRWLTNLQTTRNPPYSH